MGDSYNPLTINGGNITASKISTPYGTTTINGGNITVDYMHAPYGTVTINGGTVHTLNVLAPGIGGSYSNITINGGDVTTNAGITGSITINGGTVTAKDNYDEAGIGGYPGGTVTINGGVVTASGNNGAGIGGSKDSEGNAVVITGGVVTATSQNGDGIGNGAGFSDPDDRYTNDFTVTGNALVLASSIRKQSYKTAPTTGGIIFEDVNNTPQGYLYGDVTLAPAMVEPLKNKTVTVKLGKVLTTAGVTLDPTTTINYETYTYDTNGFATTTPGETTTTTPPTAYEMLYQPAVKDTDGYYKITNAGNMYWFSAFVNVAEGNSYPNYAANAKLLKNIDLQAGNGGAPREWTPIAVSSDNFLNFYGGIFNGNGYSIEGMRITLEEANRRGLFADIAGTVENLTVGGEISSQRNNSGGICYWNSTEGTIRNCISRVKITGHEIGGICYKNNGTIENCLSDGELKGDIVGGISAEIGDAGTMKNCLSTAELTSEIGYDGYIGGIMPDLYAYWGTIENCYYLKNYEGGTTRSGTEVTADQLQSGAVAYLLNNKTSNDTNVWRQTLGTTPDANPLPTATGTGNIVYPHTIFTVDAQGNGSMSEAGYLNGNTTAPTPTVQCADGDKTASSITLTALPGQDQYGTAYYSKDSGATWQANPMFSGLAADTAYTFSARYAGGDGYSASEVGKTEQPITTAKAQYSISIPTKVKADNTNFTVAASNLKLGTGDTVKVSLQAPEGTQFTNGALTLTRTGTGGGNPLVSQLYQKTDTTDKEVTDTAPLVQFTQTGTSPTYYFAPPPGAATAHAGEYTAILNFVVEYVKAA